MENVKMSAKRLELKKLIDQVLCKTADIKKISYPESVEDMIREMEAFLGELNVRSKLRFFNNVPLIDFEKAFQDLPSKNKPTSIN